jgi:murein L,D-transpeptidase YcbB/YkuD
MKGVWRACIPFAMLLAFGAETELTGSASAASAAPHKSATKAKPKTASKKATPKKAVAKAPQPKPEVKPPVDVSAITREIQDRASGSLKRFYAARAFAPLWAQQGNIGPEAAVFLDYLRSADLDGLNPSSYNVDDLRDAIEDARAGDPDAIAYAELRLSNALARYVRDLRKPGPTEMIYADDRLKPKKLRPEAILAAASAPPSFSDYITNMQWMSVHYLRMRKLLALAQQSGSTPEEIARIRVNLERARPLPGPWTYHIVVDAASARLWYYQGGKQQGTMRIVVGAFETQTPMLAGMVQWAILNPYWNVPDYLAQKKIAPKILEGRTLDSMRMEALSDWSSSARTLDASTINWEAVASGTEEVRLRQLPGGANSMGKVKFLFPNDEGIYLHDTPDKSLFTKKDRHLSNGCIRLEDAASLGKWLLGKPLGAAASDEPEQATPLPRPVPVYLTYFTVTQTKTGFAFLDDIYKRDP